MPYRYLEDIAIADVAFEARGAGMEDMFTAAADALLNVMVDDLAAIRSTEHVEIAVEHEASDLLLFNFLNELIFYKDARLLLLRVSSLTISRRNDLYSLQGVLSGERIDPARHHMNVDVKAVTLHRFSVKQTGQEWLATVVLDI